MWSVVRRAFGSGSVVRGQSQTFPVLAGPVKVFLSYAREDEAFVERLRDDLMTAGCDVWWDREAMASRNRTFLQEIRDAIEAADHVVAVISPEAVESRYVRYEWDHAYLFCRGVVPILRRGAFNILPPEFAALHCEDFRKDGTYERARLQLVRILSEPVPPLGSVRATPALPPHFLPRRDVLDTALDTILADVRRPTVVSPREQVTVLHGMAGVGKSVTAAALARSVEARRSFTDGVVWVSFGPSPDLLAKLRVVIAQLTDVERHYPDVDVARAQLEIALRDKVCLLVLDDVWDVAHVTPFRSALGPRARLLITSRDRSITTSIAAQEHHLGLLPREDALALLGSWVGAAGELPVEASVIVAEVGGLPLGLALCGAMIRDGTSWTDVMQALKAADLRFLEAQFPDYPYPSVFKSLKVSVDVLTQKNPPAARVYEGLAVFPAEVGIPEAAVLRLARYRTGLNDRDTRLAMVALERKALLQLHGSEPHRLVTLHGLQYDYVRSAATDIVTLHGELLDAYDEAHAAGWADCPDDGYFFEHAASHFVAARRVGELHALIENRPWYERKRDLDPSGLAYVADVRTALEHAGQSDVMDIPRLVAYCWLWSAVKSLAKEVPLEALDTMALLGQSQQALRYAEMIPDIHRYVWALRRLVAHFVETAEFTVAVQIAERLRNHVTAVDEELQRTLIGPLPTRSELVSLVADRNRLEPRSKISDLLRVYMEVGDDLAVLELDREVIFLEPLDFRLRMYAWSSGLGALGRWSMTRVDFPAAANAAATPAEEQMLELMPILAPAVKERPVDRTLLRGAVAEALAETSKVEESLAIAADLDDPLMRLHVLSLVVPMLAVDDEHSVIAEAWSQIAPITGEDYVGATEDRVRILSRVATALLGTPIAVAAMQQAYSLCTTPGLAEAVAAGALNTEVLQRATVRQARDTLFEDMFGGGSGRALLTAQCFFAAALGRHAAVFGDKGAALLDNARKLVERGTALEAAMKDKDDRIGALCALAEPLSVLGRKAEAASLIDRAEGLAIAQSDASRAPALARIAYALARIGEPARAHDMLRRTLKAAERELDTGFSVRFLKAWAKAAVHAGDVDSVVALALASDDQDVRLSVLSDAAMAFAATEPARGAALAETVRREHAESGKVANPVSCATLAVSFALAENPAAAEQMVDLAVAGLLGLEVASARVQDLIDVIHVFAEAGLSDLAMRLGEKLPEPGLRAIAYGAILRESATRALPVEDLANAYLWTAGTALEAGEQSYYLPLALLMAARAIMDLPNDAAVRAAVAAQMQANAAESGSAPADGDLVANATSRAKHTLGELAARDGDIGILRAVNAMRLAAGLRDIPLEALQGMPVDRAWEIMTAQSLGRTADPPTLAEIRDRCLSRDNNGSMRWFDMNLEGVVSRLQDNELCRPTWERIQSLSKVFARN